MCLTSHFIHTNHFRDHLIAPPKSWNFYIPPNLPASAGFLRSGIHADYSFYKPYNEESSLPQTSWRGEGLTCFKLESTWCRETDWRFLLKKSFFDFQKVLKSILKRTDSSISVQDIFCLYEVSLNLGFLRHFSMNLGRQQIEDVGWDKTLANMPGDIRCFFFSLRVFP